MDDNYHKKNVSDTITSPIKKKKKCKWHNYKPNQKLLSCMLLWKKIIKILWHSFEIFIFKKREKSLFCLHFCKHCFSCSSLIPAYSLYVSTISVAKHSIKRVGVCFLICFGNKLQDFLIKEVNSGLIIAALSLRKISVTNTHA